MNAKDTIPLIGQLLVLVVLTLIASFFIYIISPGNFMICDKDGLIIYPLFLVFTICSIGILINSIAQYRKGKWRAYRLISIGFTISLIVSIFIFRPLYFLVVFDDVIIKLEENEQAYIELELYENKRFYVDYFESGCGIEKVGTYQIINDQLLLEYDSNKTSYFGKLFKIEENEAVCLDCDIPVYLKMSFNNKN
ncbi:hypothetical protein LX97_00260 [Nonlabens dokdonensis]|jgi:hypothetical protein|uniref:Uncharacterized protein n=2 Tax=Nonlabens dokdonensis TaxID=328515 RepID=L7W5U5_NONDD|nr:hypothetical protein [Nonlabens dokdonensis]AGC75567.1 hypothetical protein DDD_0440 [Nonlabens dokdonensis DSW-6]PZX43260.1 hypothetical protein LX97_00260 [Nonlabens dokdonensis]